MCQKQSHLYSITMYCISQTTNLFPSFCANINVKFHSDHLYSVKQFLCQQCLLHLITMPCISQTTNTCPGYSVNYNVSWIFPNTTNPFPFLVSITMSHTFDNDRLYSSNQQQKRVLVLVPVTISQSEVSIIQMRD